MIQHICAVTFAIRNMSLSVDFYRKLGFELIYGGVESAFSTLKVGGAFVNLSTSPGYESRWWGRVIFRVSDVDDYHRTLLARGLVLDAPQDAPWGERFFHATDPDGHELSFAELLPNATGITSIVDR